MLCLTLAVKTQRVHDVGTMLKLNLEQCPPEVVLVDNGVLNDLGTSPKVLAQQIFDKE